jgi:ABC-2 type transport system ATP-binding protein
VGLDPVLRRQLWDTFADLAYDGRAIIVSSHVMDEASRCDRLLLMREGHLIADDTPKALLARTGTSDVESAFLEIVEAEEER